MSRTAPLGFIRWAFVVLLVMMHAVETSPQDAALRESRRRILDEMAPGTKIQPYSWSGGDSEALVVGEGEPLLLVHGGFSSSLEWIPLLPLLAREHRVIAPDRPGCGLASPFDYRGVDVEAHSAVFLRETMDALDLGPATVVGNSMGGRWAIALAMRHPEAVRRLVLVGAPAGSEGKRLPMPLRALRTPGLRQLVKRRLLRGTPRETREFAGKMIVAQPDRLPEAFWSVFAQNQARNIHGWLPFAANVIGLDMRVGPNLRLDGRLDELKVPTHFVWGERDVFADVERGRGVAAEVGGATFETVPDAGHLPWLDEPERVAAAVLRATRGNGPAT